jgi:hypothetical protein
MSIEHYYMYYILQIEGNFLFHSSGRTLPPLHFLIEGSG